MIRSLICMALAFGGLLAGGNALAEDANISHAKVVLSDRQLNDPAQAGAVYAKLYRAAQKACQSEGEGPAWRLSDDRACETEAMKAAVGRLDRPQLTQFFAKLKAESTQVALTDNRR